MTRLPTTTMNDESLRRSLAVSGTLHLLGLLFLFFGLPSFIKPLPPPSIPIPFEIVDIADITNTRIKDQPEEAPKPPEPPKPEEKKLEPPPPPPPQPVAQPPEPPKPETKPEQVEAVLPSPPKPQVKPEPPKPKQEKPKQDMLASVLKNVEKMKPATPAKAPEVPTETKTQAQAQPKSNAPALSSRLTISEEDALRRQIELHWNVPIGARDIQNMVVEVRITVNPDRSVQGVEVVDKSRMATDSYFRSMAESVVRAVYASSPLQVPDGKYEQWKVIDSYFSAKDML